MTPRIFPANAAAEYWFDEGCWILELLNDPQDPDMSIARARVAPRATTRWHALDGIVERYVILAGEGRVEIGDLPPRTLRVHDAVVIPEGTRQRITNTGVGDLVFLAICSPRFHPGAYVDLEPA